MLRASSLLKNTRLDKSWELIEISKKLKIPIKSLEAIENEDVSNFPSEPYCSLIIKDYADFLGLNGEDTICLFRRDFDQRNKNKINQNRFFSFTPQFTFTVSVFVIILLFSFYLIFEYIKFNQPPKLKVNWPFESTASSQTVNISGITDSESTIRVNQDLIIIDNQGNFQKKIDLIEGDNKIIIESKSPSGKTTVEEKIIKYLP
ncbi:MAG: helix-turn-helix domain-containing protein [Candidatus Shapirobacteria bacterium]|jgi:cytoskeletal protein RodZ